MHAIMNSGTKEPPDWADASAALNLVKSYLVIQDHATANAIDNKFAGDDQPPMWQSRNGFRRYLYRDGMFVVRRTRACGTFVKKLGAILNASK